jgi:hypothetical protein
MEWCDVLVQGIRNGLGMLICTLLPGLAGLALPCGPLPLTAAVVAPADLGWSFQAGLGLGWPPRTLRFDVW